MAKDVIVVVQRDALPSKAESLDILLISTAGDYPVGTYYDAAEVEAVYGTDGPCPNAKIVRKAKTLFNQGKTTLAETLVNKIKVVSFARTPDTPGATASLSITFPATLPDKIEEGSDVTLIIGTASVSIATFDEIRTGQDLAELFFSTNFTLGGVTYSSTVSGTTVTYTAVTDGEVDPLPERVTVNVENDGVEEEDFNTGATATFTNGTDAVSGDTPSALIDQIKAFRADVDDDWYLFLTDRDEVDFVKALAKYAELSEPTEADLGAGVEDHRKFYMGQTSDKSFVLDAARSAVIYTDAQYLDEEPDASYVGNVAPYYPNSVTWKFKRPQNGNLDETALISLPNLREAERSALLDNHINFLTEEYKRQYVKDGTCLDGEFIDVVIGGDWIAKRMRDLLYEILLTNPSIEYSDAGFGLIATAVLQALAEAADYGIIAKDQESRMPIIEVTIPKYEDSTETQRRNRVMPDILWEAQLGGAIHQVKAKGALRASL